MWITDMFLKLGYKDQKSAFTVKIGMKLNP